jgi:hypothetical protein
LSLSKEATLTLSSSITISVLFTPSRNKSREIPIGAKAGP